MQHASRTIVGLCVVGLGILVLGAAVSAAPVIDGRYDPTEGYTTMTNMLLMVEGGPTPAPDPATLWTHQDPGTGDLSVLLIQPLSLVDNTYGANSIGWGSSASSGKNHNFKDLLGSDKAQFTFTDGQGQVVLDVEMDYLSETGKGSGVYVSNGVSGKDGKVLVGSASDVIGVGTSLDYNFNTLNHNTFTTDSPLSVPDYSDPASAPGWIFEVAYEIKVDGSLFAANGLGGVTVPVVHDSPNKIDKNKVFGDPPDLKIIKFEDADRDGLLGDTEVLLPDWQFLVEGPDNFSLEVTTAPDGMIWLSGLEAGAYTITELTQTGWEITTPNPIDVTLDGDTLVTVEFGNYKGGDELIPEPASSSLFLLGLIAARRRRRK